MSMPPESLPRFVLVLRPDNSAEDLQAQRRCLALQFFWPSEACKTWQSEDAPSHTTADTQAKLRKMEDEVIQVREVMETLTATLLRVGKLHCLWH